MGKDGGDKVVNFSLLALLPLALYLALFIFVIYFLIKVLKFMDIKIKIDLEKNEKIDRLIEIINQEKNE